eukprot:1195670-Prorocentrum_minimum.AAC.1
MASALTSLSSLDLSTNNVTDAGVMSLAPLTALISLNLRVGVGRPQPDRDYVPRGAFHHGCIVAASR